MASDETMTIHSSTQEDDYDDYIYDHDHEQPHPLNLSRLSVCTSSSNLYENDENDDDDDVGHGNYYQAAEGNNGMRMFMSRLSIESFDADGEYSDEKEGKELTGLSSDSDSEQGCYSLPATPRRRNRGHGQQLIEVKEYASENEAKKGLLARKKTRNNVRRRKIIRKRCLLEKAGWETFDCNKMSKNNMMMDMGGTDAAGVNSNCQSVSGESDQGGAGGGAGGCSGAGVMVITRPKGGRRSLCMDLEEVKACRDLGFELEHERMMEIPSRLSISGSPLDTSSGGNSPIANWRISSPGDDPRDVKARLKVWAQVVALASTSRQGS
ncbi:hypothetical protein I3843_07G125000 [Carya illinoinensis]|uniref:Fold protein n=1 Tax=Carya illinoinensis TaxID=32201 RepID=A0A8T1Q4H0_CARIL|nr:uncharacterized protein LOC122315122 [Carya illinoinensis]KAG2697882.1 hypothetical protein I3760_07G125800 [Carya illinoinensis]KAG6648132.1 hypothetical protein CIPAW_07G126700 [Carya illinoinensis]KAG6704339.1 hypothetical protein I3842_07G130000 [Carya illinoinensis]KAG7971246.1 hypothetical protein I3843_07G125000 [Carya illinoinensis]